MRSSYLRQREQMLKDIAKELGCSKNQALTFLIEYYHFEQLDALTTNILKRHKQGLNIVELTKLRMLKAVLNNLPI